MITLTFIMVLITVFINRIFHLGFNTGGSVPKVIMKAANIFRFLLCIKKTVSKRRLRPSVYQPQNIYFNQDSDKFENFLDDIEEADYKIQTKENLKKSFSKDMKRSRLLESVYTKVEHLKRRRRIPSQYVDDSETDTLEFTSNAASLSTNNSNLNQHNRKKLLASAVLRQAIRETELLRKCEWVFVSEILDRVLCSLLLVSLVTLFIFYSYKIIYPLKSNPIPEAEVEHDITCITSL